MSSSLPLLRALCVAAILITGCAVEGKPYTASTEIPSDHAMIFVYRPYKFMGVSDDVSVTCGRSGQAIGAGGYHGFIDDPGLIRCYTVNEPSSEVKIEAKPHETYFVRIDLVAGFPHPNPILSLVEANTAQPEISNCKLQ
jgi:hypothetical protein